MPSARRQTDAIQSGEIGDRQGLLAERDHGLPCPGKKPLPWSPTLPAPGLRLASRRAQATRRRPHRPYPGEPGKRFSPRPDGPEPAARLSHDPRTSIEDCFLFDRPCRQRRIALFRKLSQRIKGLFRPGSRYFSTSHGNSMILTGTILDRSGFSAHPIHSELPQRSVDPARLRDAARTGSAPQIPGRAPIRL